MEHHDRAAGLTVEGEIDIVDADICLKQCFQKITDWERVCGLPGERLADDSVASLQGRRAAVVNVLTRVGGQTPAFFKRLAAIYRSPGNHQYQ